MILVRMGEQDSIQAGDSGSEHLVTEIRCGIHHDPCRSGLNQDAGPEALILFIGGVANRTGTGDHRYAGTGTGSKKGDF